MPNPIPEIRITREKPVSMNEFLMIEFRFASDYHTFPIGKDMRSGV